MSRLWGRGGAGVKEKPPLREVLWGVVKYSSPRHAEKCSICPFWASRGDISFTEDVSQAVGRPAGAIFLSLRLAGSAGGGRGARRRGQGPMPRASARLRCPWAVAGPGRASRRRAERSSRRGRLAGGPPPTGTPSSPAHTQPGTRSPAHAAHTARGPKRRSASGPCVNRVSSQVELDVAAGDGLDQLARVVLNRVVE